MDKILRQIDSILKQQDIRKAEITIAKHLRNNLTSSQRAALLYRRAKARLLDARPDDALEDLETSLALDTSQKSNSNTTILFGDIFFARYELAPVGFTDRADVETAKAYYTESQKQDPANHPAWINYQLGRIALSKGNTADAQTLFKKVLDFPSDPDHIHAFTYERLGFIEFFEVRNPHQALDYFQKAQAHYPTDDDAGWRIELHVRMSRAYLSVGHHQQALITAQAALKNIQESSKINHRDLMSEAHLAIGEILSNMPDQEENAIEHYLRFLQSSKRPPGIDVTWSQVHESIGDLSFTLKRYQQAISSYEKALEHNPYHPWEVNVQYQIARCYYRMRNYEKAVKMLRLMQDTALEEHNPITDWGVLNLLGNAYFALERYQQAIIAYQQAIDLAPVGTNIEKTKIYLRFSEELVGSSEPISNDKEQK